MTRLPPLWLQDGAYPAVADRQLATALWPPGGHLTGDPRHGPAYRSDGLVPVAVPGTLDWQVPPGRAAVPMGDGTVVLCATDETTTLPAAPSGDGMQRLDQVLLRVGATGFDFELNPGLEVPAGSEDIRGPFPANAVVLVEARVRSATLDDADIAVYVPGGLSGGGPLNGDAVGPRSDVRVNGIRGFPLWEFMDNPQDWQAVTFKTDFGRWAGEAPVIAVYPGPGIGLSANGGDVVVTKTGGGGLRAEWAIMGGDTSLTGWPLVATIPTLPPGLWFVAASSYVNFTAAEQTGDLSAWLRSDWHNIAGGRWTVWGNQAGNGRTVGLTGLYQIGETWNCYLQMVAAGTAIAFGPNNVPMTTLVAIQCSP